MLSAHDRSVPIRVVIADDHALVRDGLKRILQDNNDIQVVGEAEDGNQALAQVWATNPDVLLLDLAMPRLDGLGVLRQLANAPISTATILLTAAIGKPEISTALQLGARGLILKSSTLDVLVKAIRCVVAGEYWVDRSTLADLVKTPPVQAAPKYDLTPRELEIVCELASGACNKDIGNKFGISDKTVKRHLANIFDKLNVSTRLELAVFAINHGLGSASPQRQ